MKELEVHEWEDMEIKVFPVSGGFNVHWSDASAEVVIWVQGVASRLWRRTGPHGCRISPGYALYFI